MAVSARTDLQLGVIPHGKETRPSHLERSEGENGAGTGRMLMPFPDRTSIRPGTTRRVRLKDFDYSTPGYYFITICTHNRHHYFGSIAGEVLSLTPAGNMVADAIRESESVFPSTAVDSFIVMPNHIHVLFGQSVRLEDEPGTTDLIDVVQWLKSTTHQRFRKGVLKHRWTPYDRLVWQEGYHDHIVRNERELDALRAYVMKNVATWEKDRFYDGIVG